MIIEIPLTRNKVALIDAADLELVSKYKWYAVHNQNGDWYAVRTPHRGKRTLFMHQFITGAAIEQQVDHKNMDGLDNRRENLRPCTPSQNRQNSRKYKTANPYKGVRITTTHKYCAYIKSGGKQLHLGTFSDPVSAALAYDKKAREIFGEFARPNFTEEVR